MKIMLARLSLAIILMVSLHNNYAAPNDNNQITNALERYLTLESFGIKRTIDVDAELESIACDLGFRENTYRWNVYRDYKIDDIKIENDSAIVKVIYNVIGIYPRGEFFKPNKKRVVEKYKIKKINGDWKVCSFLPYSYWKAVILDIEKRDNDEIKTILDKPFTAGRKEIFNRLDKDIAWLSRHESKVIAQSAKEL